MRWPVVKSVMHKDLATILRNKGVRIPLVAAPFVILVLLPILLVTGGEFLSQAAPVALQDPTGGGATLADRFTPDTATAITGIDGRGGWAAFVLKVFLAPLYLLIPLMVATVIAADSFAGERDRGTLEALLHTPTTDTELLTAKFLAAWVPAMAVSLGGFVVYSVVANLVAWPLIGAVFFPDLTWIVLAFFVTPAIAALGLGIMVIVSSRVQSLQAAHQFGSLVVLPIILLLVAQISGTLLFDTTLVLAMGVIVWLMALVVLRAAARSFRREQLASRL